MYQEKPQQVLPYLYNQHVCDIKALHPLLDNAGISIHRSNANAIVIDANSTHEALCGVTKDKLLGFSHSNVPIKGKAYRMRPEHIAVFKQLCNVPRGTGMYLSSSAEYHGEMATKLGVHGVAGHTENMLANWFKGRQVFQVLCIYEHPNDWRVEGTYKCHCRVQVRWHTGSHGFSKQP